MLQWPADPNQPSRDVVLPQSDYIGEVIAEACEHVTTACATCLLGSVSLNLSPLLWGHGVLQWPADPV